MAYLRKTSFLEGSLPLIRHFFLKFENSKWPPFLGREIFLKIANSTFLSTLWVENFDEIALSRTVKEIEANLCFSIFGKNSNIQNGRHF